MTDYVPHRRQFVVARQPMLQDGWRSRPISNGLILSHCPELGITEDAATGRLHLGQYWLNGTAGRHVTIDGDWLTLDFCGLSTCYYATGPDGPVLSSSPALVRKACGLPRNPRLLRWREMNWQPLPGSTGVGMANLLRDQAIHIGTHEIRHIPREVPRMGSVAAASEALAEHLVATVQALPDERLLLGLTAGLDSRTLLAALIASGRRFDTFTQNIKDYSGRDIRIAKTLAQRYGVAHRTEEPKAVLDTDVVARWEAHTDNSYCDADNTLLLPRGQFAFLRKTDILIRGVCFEFGRMHFERRLGTQLLGTATPASMLAAFKADPAADASAYEAVEAWLQWRRAHPYDLPFAESFYIDNRLGGWASAFEHATDGLPCLSVQPGNSPVVLSAVITPENPVDRVAGRVQREAAERLVPGILDIPLNPVPFGSAARKRVRGKAGAILRRLGLRPRRASDRVGPAAR